MLFSRHVEVITVTVIVGPDSGYEFRLMGEDLPRMASLCIGLLRFRITQKKLCQDGAARGLGFMTGGLGPTRDDITKQTLANYFGMELRMNDEVLQRISAAHGRGLPCFR